MRFDREGKRSPATLGGGTPYPGATVLRACQNAGGEGERERSKKGKGGGGTSNPWEGGATTSATKKTPNTTKRNVFPLIEAKLRAGGATLKEERSHEKDMGEKSNLGEKVDICAGSSLSLSQKKTESRSTKGSVRQPLFGRERYRVRKWIATLLGERKEKRERTTTTE